MFTFILGNGLFCRENIRKGQQIVHFIGKVFATRKEVCEAEQVGERGGYVIWDLGLRLLQDSSPSSVFCKHGKLSIHVQRCA